VSEGAIPRARAPGIALDPWLWNAPVDLAAFAGSAVVALALSAAAGAAGITAVSDLAWLFLVLGIDVAHVHSTWLRTYFDREELARQKLRYVAVPLALYVAGLGLYLDSPLGFWRVLAYLAVFHFVRQQAGWVALYRARSGEPASASGRLVDTAAIYAATAFPLFFWHAHAESRRFSWFVSGDFVSLPLERWVPLAAGVWGLLLGAFCVRELHRARVTRRLALGKILVVLSTALTWAVGIVFSNSDFVFTATNVIPHGVPYAILLALYARERARRRPEWRFAPVVATGVSGFVCLVLGLAFVEELAWDRFVDHDRSWLFGQGSELGGVALALIVPLLALPQATHYVLDGLLWRRAETRALPAQRAALGLEPRVEPASAAFGSATAAAANGGKG